MFHKLLGCVHQASAETGQGKTLAWLTNSKHREGQRSMWHQIKLGECYSLTGSCNHKNHFHAHTRELLASFKSNRPSRSRFEQSSSFSFTWMKIKFNSYWRLADLVPKKSLSLFPLGTFEDWTSWSEEVFKLQRRCLFFLFFFLLCPV